MSEKKQYRSYVAYSKSTKDGRLGSRITSVLADDLSSARKRIKETLSQPGRYHIRDRWIEQGAVVRSEGSVTNGVTLFKLTSTEFSDVWHWLWSRESAEALLADWNWMYSTERHPEAGIITDHNVTELAKQRVLFIGDDVDFQFNSHSMGERTEVRTVTNIWMEVDGSEVWGEAVFLGRVVQVRRWAGQWRSDHIIRYVEE